MSAASSGSAGGREVGAAIAKAKRLKLHRRQEKYKVIYQRVGWVRMKWGWITRNGHNFSIEQMG